MSTRATYQFGPITLYIHHDGYPEGAAFYLYRTLCHPNARGSLAERCIRANDGAEITESHDAHGDTEFRYTVTGTGPEAQIVAEAVARGSWAIGAERKWCVVYFGPLHRFIDKHAKEFADWLDAPYSAFRQVKGTYGASRWLNLHLARERLNGEHGPLRHLRIWAQMPSPMEKWAANWQAVLEELAGLIEAFPELGTDETAALLADLGAKCPA